MSRLIPFSTGGVRSSARVSLISMPFLFWDGGVFPVMALPYLTSYLRRAGCTVFPHDFNIEARHWLSRPAIVEELGGRLRGLVEELGWARSVRGQALARAAAQADGAYLWCPLIRDLLAAAGGDFRGIDFRITRQLWGHFHESLMAELPYETSPLEWTVEEMNAAAETDRGTVLDSMIRGWLAGRVLDDRPDLVGFSLITEDQIFPTLVLARELKRRRPQLMIVAGGPLISAIADKLPPAAFRFIDYYVRFDGEPALDGLLALLAGRGDPSAIPNLVFARGGRTEVNDVREGPALDFLPRADFEGLDMGLYNRSPEVEGPWLSINTTRGCAYGRCTYCSDPAYSSPKFKSPERAVAEMLELQERYGIRKFLFADSYIPPAHMRRIAAALADRKAGLRWVMQTRPETALSDETIAEYAASGCNELWFGMESMSEEVLRFIQKGIARQTMERIVAACLRNDIRITLNVMIGVPGETEQDAVETLGFVNSLNQRYPALVFRCNTSFVNIPRLSAFGRDPARFGIEIIEEFDWSPLREWAPPSWVFESKVLDGQPRIFSSSYVSGADLQSRSAARPARLTPDAVPARREGVYTYALPFDPGVLVQSASLFQQKVHQAVARARCRRQEARTRVNDLLAGLHPERHLLRPGTYTFHLGRTFNRKVVELKPVFRRLLDSVDDRTPTSAIPAKLGVRSSREAEACSAGLAKLLKGGLIDVRQGAMEGERPAL
jgi:hypothetical protein